mmetsp:Transcript_12551/g.35634  ORF Transcript_12551/g.35634 Transcript_12551/m.35634 type:complete len:397 (-) Transcript_12551:670-1860(-)|eukprot:CAMPEP_0172369450 /NCGR_PEP_ID=MMETSP1060-20121228/32982_1 /TAXON_ID=37318 /ORGANISM="Pseudo-nitzschia pungens, Strain cf. cingulata" /LENGTH=396 /DNA_ID=CAMNT_0013094385 /DNA_START=113 /DNA_END=1303 /DNA_ORIENTATION=-
MNLFKSSRKAEKDEPVRAIIGDFDEESNYPYEDEAKTAAEMESILGNALSMTERDNGNIIGLRRSNTFEMGRRIASMGSQEDFSASGSQLDPSDGYSYVSRASSLQSAASMPTFLKVDAEDSAILTQKSWDGITGGETQSHTVPTGHEFGNPGNATIPGTTSGRIGLARGRSWSKLRREIDLEKHSPGSVGCVENESAALSRSMSIGRKAFKLRKKTPRTRPSSNNKTEKESAKNLLSKIQKYRSEGKNPFARFGTGGNSEKSNSMHRSYAKDYDVEVSLEEKKSLWKQLSKRGEETKHGAWIRKSKSRPENRLDSKDRSDAFGNNSFDTPTTTNTNEDVFASPNDTKGAMNQQSSNVVVLPTADVLFESLEVVCCHFGDKDKTLDRIADAIPPQF